MKNNEYLLISPMYPPPLHGGSVVYIYNLVENCPVGLDILTSSLKDGFEEISSPRHKLIRKKRIFSPKGEAINPTALDLCISYYYMLFILYKMNRSKKYKAVIVNAECFANGFFFFLGKLLKIPVIGVGFAEEYTRPFHRKGLKNFIKTKWIKYTQKQATGFIVICDFCKEILIDIGVDANKIFVIPPSINPEKLGKMNKKKNGHSNILSVGRVIERKGFHFLIDAVNRLKNDIPNIKLTIVGDGPYTPVLKKRIIDYNLENIVNLKGNLFNDKELSQLYEQSDLFVLAHMMLDDGDTEGCPLVFTEASGNGLPVIGGTGAGASTCIIEGKTGYIVNSRDIDALANRIKTILTNPQLAEKMSVAGIEKIKRDHNVFKTGIDFYHSINTIAEN